MTNQDTKLELEFAELSNEYGEGFVINMFAGLNNYIRVRKEYSFQEIKFGMEGIREEGYDTRRIPSYIEHKGIL